MMTYLIIIGIVIISFLVIKLVTNGLTENVNYAFVEDPDGEGKTVSIKRERNKTIYKEGDKVVDLSGYDKFIIHGLSLVRAGLPDGSFIYTKKLDGEPIDSICNHFVVLDYDKDHPEMKLEEGFRVRKAIAILPNRLDHDTVKKKISDIIDNDDEINDKTHYIELLLKIYQMTSNNYENEDELILSLTYKKGLKKDYSFHPVKFLYGVVKYKSIS